MVGRGARKSGGGIKQVNNKHLRPVGSTSIRGDKYPDSNFLQVQAILEAVFFLHAPMEKGSLPVQLNLIRFFF